MQLELLTQTVGVWGYLILLLLVMIEGPVATLAGAMAAAAGFMNPEGVFVAAAVGNLMADCLWYGLGYLGKIEWLERYGRWAGVTHEHVNRMRGDIEKHSAKLLLIAKLTLGFAIPTLVATGLSRVPVRRWLPSLLLGETLWTGVLVYAGYHLTRYVQTFERGVEFVALAGALIGAGLLVFYIGKVRQKRLVKPVEIEIISNRLEVKRQLDHHH